MLRFVCLNSCLSVVWQAVEHRSTEEASVRLGGLWGVSGAQLDGMRAEMEEVRADKLRPGERVKRLRS